MYAGWNRIFTLIIGALTTPSNAFWPFSNGAFASLGHEEARIVGAVGNERLYAPGVKRVAIIGM